MVAVRAGGVVLIIAGLWVVAQVLGGNALGRLGISGQAEAAVGGALPGAA